MSYCSTTKEPIYFVINIWGAIGACIFVPLTIWSLHKYRVDHALQRQNRVATPNCLYHAQMAFYVFCLLYLISFLVIHIFRCIPPSIWWMFANIGFLSYIVHWALLIAIYLARLYYVFRDTVYQLNKRHICYYIGFALCLIVGIVLIQVIRMVYYQYNLNLLAWVVSLLLISMLNIVLSGMFVVRLNRVNSEVDTAANTTKTVALMRKYTVLTIGSSCTTLIFIVFLGVMNTLPRTATVQNIADMLNSLDVYMDILCSTLTFSFAKSAYYQLCACCDHGLARCCGHTSDDEAKLKSMSSIELHVSKTKSFSTSDNAAPNSPVSSTTNGGISA